MQTPAELRYTSDHEWVRTEGDGTLVVGITDFAQDALGDIVYVQLPDAARVVASGESCAEIESVKSVSEIYAPVAGEVLEVNQSLEAAPEQINADPYGSGWLMRLKVAEGASLDHLLDAAAYEAHTGT